MIDKVNGGLTHIYILSIHRNPLDPSTVTYGFGTTPSPAGTLYSVSRLRIIGSRLRLVSYRVVVLPLFPCWEPTEDVC